MRKEKITDGLTKALPRQRFRDFIEMISLVDIQARLQADKRLEALREEIQEGGLMPIRMADRTKYTLAMGGSLTELEVLRQKEWEQS